MKRIPLPFSWCLNFYFATPRMNAATVGWFHGYDLTQRNPDPPLRYISPLFATDRIAFILVRS